MKQLPREIQSIMQEIRFVTEGGSCFECCDYEGMVAQLGEVLQKHLPQEQEAKPQIEIKKAHKTKDKGGRFYGNCPSCRNRICISMDIG